MDPLGYPSEPTFLGFLRFTCFGAGKREAQTWRQKSLKPWSCVLYGWTRSPVHKGTLFLFDIYAQSTYNIQRKVQRKVVNRFDRQITAKLSLKCLYLSSRFLQSGLHSNPYSSKNCQVLDAVFNNGSDT